MKKILILGAVLISGFTFAQAAKPILEQEGQLVKATYYYDNGKIQQQGYFKDGKLEGQWVSLMLMGIRNLLVNIKMEKKPGNGFFGMINRLAK